MNRPCEPLTQDTSSTFHVLRLTPHVFLWSGRWDLNPRQPAWKAGALPLSYARPARTHAEYWWAGKDSNLGSRWQQIYSLPPLATWVPARNSLHTTQKSTRSIIIVLFHPYDEKRRASWSTHSSPFLIIKDESGDLWAQPCSGNARFY